MRDFWLTCGHHLIDRDAGGGLLVTDKFLRVYLARPELLPPSDACGAEQKLYAALRAAPPPPPRGLTTAEISPLPGGDARGNWEVVIRFPDRLFGQRTRGVAFLVFIRPRVGKAPPPLP